MFKKALHIALVRLLCASAAYAHWEVRSINVENGLAQSSVYTVCQDSKGIMWLGTGEGLSRYDGYNIINYSPGSSDDKNTLGGKGVHFIFCVNDSEIVLSHEKGIDRFNTNTGVFTHLLKYSFSNVMSYRPPFLIMQLYKKGFVSLNVQTGVITTINSMPQVLLSGVCISQGDDYFISDKEGMLTTLNIKTHFISRYPIPANVKGRGNIYHLDFISPTSINITTSAGNCLFDIQTHTFKKLSGIAPAAILHKTIASYFKDSKGNKWWSVEGEGIYLEPTDRPLQMITKYEKGYSENAKEVYKFYEDKEGNIWACTEGSGAWIISNHTNDITSVSEIIKDNNRTKLGLVFGMAADTASGQFYVGTYKNGFYTVDTNGIIKALPIKLTQGSIYELFIRCIAIQNMHTLLIGTDKGLYQVDRSAYTARKISLPAELTDIMYIRHFSKNEFFVCTNGFTAILTFNADGHTQVHSLLHSGIPFISRFTYPISDSSYIFLRNWSNPILFIKHSNGLEETKEINTFRMLGLVYVTYMNGYYWWASADGLIKTTRDFRLIKKYTTEQGMANNHIYTLAGAGHFLWLSTNKGLTRFNIDDETFKNYTLEDGLQSYEFNTNSCACLNNNYMAFGGINGLNLIRLYSKATLPVSPKIILTALRVNDSSYLNPLSVFNLKYITLDHNHNTLALTALPLSFSDTRYHTWFKLEGLDKQWYSSIEGALRYTHLPAGHYILKARLLHEQDRWLPETTLLYINILPPFWQQWWFYLMCIAAVLGTVSGIVYYISTRQLKQQLAEIERQRALEQMRSRISRDIHDDIGSGLTKIALQSELLKQQLENTQAKQKAGKLAEASKELIANLSNVIWSMNPRHDNLQGLLAYMREYAHDYLEPAQVNVSIHFPDTLPDIHVNPELRRNLFMILKEALQNIVKSAEAQNVDIRFELNDSAYIFVIADDGKGFDKNDTRYFGNGLVNMQKRASLSKAEFTIDSTPGKGASITIKGAF